jgi:hypothetical protein
MREAAIFPTRWAGLEPYTHSTSGRQLELSLSFCLISAAVTIVQLLLQQNPHVNMAPHAENGNGGSADKPSNLAPLEPGIPEAEAKVKMPAFPQ